MTARNTPGWPGPPYLGLVCVTKGEAVHFRTTTRRYLGTLGTAAARRHLGTIYADNTARLADAVEFCAGRGIRLYRVCSGLFPFADDPLGAGLLGGVAADLGAIGTRVDQLGMRLVMHPDQYVVLSSQRPEVVANSVLILEHHGEVLDLLGRPRSAWAAVQVHGGRRGGAEGLERSIEGLPESVRPRLVLENDERAFGSEEVLEVCRRTGVPMAFDAHHEVVKGGAEDMADPHIARVTELAATTWPDPGGQIVHLSNGREHPADRRHADFVEVVPEAYRTVPWIEVEAKAKEEAIARLARNWA